MALVREPKLLIADEPTTALDVTVQAQILTLIKDLQSEYNAGVILITHDLGVAAEVADDVVVMYGGQVMERGPIADVLTRPAHPYTWGLLKSVTRLDRERQPRLQPIPGQPARAGEVRPDAHFTLAAAMPSCWTGAARRIGPLSPLLPKAMRSPVICPASVAMRFLPRRSSRG